MATSYTSNNENEFPHDLRTKSLVQQAPAAAKRIALSTISDNVPPKPKASQKLTAKSLSGMVCHSSFVPAKPSAIAIFEDKPEEKVESVNTEDELSNFLPSNVTQLFKFQEQPQFLTDSTDFSPDSETLHEGSPMVLDSSFNSSRAAPSDDLFNCVIYDEDIYLYLRELETKFRPKPNYMQKQLDITLNMRTVLVDWLVDVAESYKMQTATVYLAVSYTDRFLSQMSVLRCKLQLVGTACLFVAAKYEEIYPPELKEFVYVTDDTYSKRQVLRMEHLILKVLAFDLSVPTAFDFLQRYCCVSSTSDQVRCLAEYICELSLLDAEPFLSFLPSVIAASSLCLANYTLEYEPWSALHTEKTGYSINDLGTCIQCLHEMYRNSTKLSYRAIPDKYKSPRYHFVADISPTENLSCVDQKIKIEKWSTCD